jgi:hypothetical protein
MIKIRKIKNLFRKIIKKILFILLLLIDVKIKKDLQKIKNLKEVLLEKTSDNLSDKNRYKMLKIDRICKFIKSYNRVSLRNCIAHHLKRYNLENTLLYSLEIPKIFRKIIMKTVFFHKIVIEV